MIKELPKTDLHCHLDGSIRLGTLIELARKQGVKLPSYTQEGLIDLVFKRRYENLVEYLSGFQYTTAVLSDAEALERTAYELAEDSYREGVRYIEVRYAPHLHVSDKFTTEEVFLAVNRGLERAKNQFNARKAVVENAEPAYDYGIIACALRQFDAQYSEYYRDLIRVHQYTPLDDMFPIASMELVRAAINIRKKLGIPVVGIDLAGAEEGYPAEDHRNAYMLAHRNFLKKTVHAGEAYGPVSVFQAITECYADRLGHGCTLFDHTRISEKDIKDPKRFVKELANYIADRRITIEVCLTSNLQTDPNLKHIKNHPYGRMRKEKLSTTFCTDNRTVSNTNMTKEISLAVDSFNLEPHELKNNIIYGFKRSFFPGSYLEKRKYVRRIIDYYETVEKKFMQ